MTMKAVLCLFVFSLGSVAPDMAGDCFMAPFYLELGCTPVPPEDNSICPVAFSCPDLHPDPTMCYYRGAAYADRAAIPQGQILSPCSQACSCRVSGEPKIDCAAVDCVTSFKSDIEDCISTFELDSCCSTGYVCGDDVSNLKTCSVDGHTYYEGQMFEPKNTAKTCICTPGWDGNVDNSTICRDINCGIELHYQNNIFKRCAPVFYGKSTCPTEFQCPTPKSKIIRGLNIRNNAGQCVFGKDSLSVGDEVAVEDACMACKCTVAPFVSCTRKADCSNKVKNQ